MEFCNFGSGRKVLKQAMITLSQTVIE